jgi:hypothetical protein
MKINPMASNGRAQEANTRGISLHDLFATVHSLLKFRFLSVVERTQHAIIDRDGVASRT